MADFYIKQNDTLPVMSVTLEEAEGVPLVNASVDSVQFRFRSTSGSILTRTPVDTGAGGIYTYAFVAGDWLTGQFAPGNYRFEALVTVGADTITIPTRNPKVIRITSPI